MASNAVISGVWITVDTSQNLHIFIINIFSTLNTQTFFYKKHLLKEKAEIFIEFHSANSNRAFPTCQALEGSK